MNKQLKNSILEQTSRVCQGISDTLRSVTLSRGMTFSIDVKTDENGEITQEEFDKVVERRTGNFGGSDIAYLMIKTSKGNISAKKLTGKASDAMYESDNFSTRVAELLQYAVDGYTFKVAKTRVIPSTTSSNGLDTEYTFSVVAPIATSAEAPKEEVQKQG